MLLRILHDKVKHLLGYKTNAEMAQMAMESNIATHRISRGVRDLRRAVLVAHSIRPPAPTIPD